MPQATLLPQATHLALILQNNTFSAHFSSYAVRSHTSANAALSSHTYSTYDTLSPDTLDYTLSSHISRHTSLPT